MVAREGLPDLPLMHYAEAKAVRERPLLIGMLCEKAADFFKAFGIHPNDLATL